MASGLVVTEQGEANFFCSGREQLCTRLATTYLKDGQGNVLGFCGRCIGHGEKFGPDVHSAFDALYVELEKKKKRKSARAKKSARRQPELVEAV